MLTEREMCLIFMFFCLRLKNIEPRLIAQHIEYVLYGVSQAPNSGYVGWVSQRLFDCPTRKLSLTAIQKTQLKKLNEDINDLFWKPLTRLLIKRMQNGYKLYNSGFYKDFGFLEFETECNYFSNQYITWNYLKTLENQGIIRLQDPNKKRGKKFYVLNEIKDYTPLVYKEPESSESSGEIYIQDILIRLGITFNTQTNGPKCKSITKFDFAILEQDKIVGHIEVDGKQHHELIHHFNKSSTKIHGPFDSIDRIRELNKFEKLKNRPDYICLLKFIESHSRDRIKNNECLEKNIPILRLRDTCSNFENIVVDWLHSDKASITMENAMKLKNYNWV